MFGLRRRVIGTVLLSVGVGCLASPLALGSHLAPTVPRLADPASLFAVVPPTLAGAGAVLVVAGVAALRNRRPGARGSFAAPLLGALVAASTVLATAGTAPATAQATVAWTFATPPPLEFAVGSALAGSTVAPVTLGAVADDLPALLVGSSLGLSAIFASPAPAFALVAGLVGVAAVAVAWAVDGDGWRP